MSIKAIIFDFGNVISLPQPEDVFEQISKATGVPAEVLPLAYELRAPFDGGDINRAELYKRVLLKAGMEKEAGDRKLCKKLGDLDMLFWSYLNPKTLEWGQELKKQGFKIAILSNMPFDFMDLYGDRVEFFKLADVPIFSCDYGIVKPERRIYEIVLEELGLSPEETVFFDDSSKNIDGAKAVGIHGFVFTTVEQAKSDLEGLLEKEGKF